MEIASRIEKDFTWEKVKGAPQTQFNSDQIREQAEKNYLVRPSWIFRIYKDWPSIGFSLTKKALRR